MPFISRKFAHLVPNFIIKKRSTAMHTQGLHVDRVDTTDSDFLTYSPYFDGHLQALYKIHYNLPLVMKDMENCPQTTVYFHGTGHCGCILNHVPIGPSNRVYISDWCTSSKNRQGARCATHGILTSGHLLTMSRGGHYFSPNMITAKGYAQSKGSGSNVLAMFICKIQNAGPQNDIMSVRNDTDILPVFLAIVNNH